MFPPDGAVLQLGAAGGGFVLSGQGDGLRWYAAGAPLAGDALTGQTVWKPAGPGFYRLEAVDQAGRRAATKVRVTE